MTPDQVMAHHARSFSPAARLLSKRDRERVARLYAICRTVDDIADDWAGPAAAARLGVIHQELRNPQTTDPVAAEARVLFSGRATGLSAFEELVRTVKDDTGTVLINDMDDLRRYAHGVAGTVGIMVCALFDIPVQWHGHAAQLGAAMQLTNICRDVCEDARDGRRYLPATLCPHAPVEIAAGRDAALADARGAIGELLTVADHLYASGRTGLPALPLRLRLAVAAAAAMYQGIGEVLRRRDCAPDQGRAMVSPRRKTILALTALLGLARVGQKPRAKEQHVET